VRYLFPYIVCVIATVLFIGCVDKTALAESSFGKMGKKTSKASPVSVLSMGRDDDDGKAKKWHIGGSFDNKESD
jgi:hypothetical protein